MADVLTIHKAEMRYIGFLQVGIWHSFHQTVNWSDQPLIHILSIVQNL